jgi:methylenetetrahydrofolate dehydrogenase (NADP+)/methenyltetrahydrofolate cyclohydrolase
MESNVTHDCRILKGSAVSKAAEEKTQERVARLRQLGVTPTLVLLSVGEDPASQVYLRRKEEASARVGIEVRRRHWEAGDDPQDLERTLVELGEDPGVHGVLLQLPLPPGWDAQALQNLLPTEKDVDGLHPVNAGRLALGQPGFVPCTPLGILGMLRHYDIDPAGKQVVVMGRSAIVGRPMANLLSQKGVDATVTVVHSRTAGMPEICRQAEILIVAIGRRQMVTAEFVRPDATVIDVGIHRLEDATRPKGFRLVGDVDADSVKPVAAALSPVPGGVGPLTVAYLLENTVLAAERLSGPPLAPDKSGE